MPTRRAASSPNLYPLPLLLFLLLLLLLGSHLDLLLDRFWEGKGRYFLAGRDHERDVR